MSLPLLSDLPDKALLGCRVLVRVDYNVPRKEGVILDEARLKATFPTLQYLLERGAKVILISHFGRPKGKVCAESSLVFLPPVLFTLMAHGSFESKQHAASFQKVFFFDEKIEDEKALRELQEKIKALPNSSIALLENIRFYPGEEANDLSFASALASLGDLYVNEAFSVTHRAHASVETLPKLLPSVFGFLFKKEVTLIKKATQNPPKPLMAIVSGSKISTKLGLLETLVEKADILVLGGGIANTFLSAQGCNMQDSLVEDALIPTAQKVLKKAKLIGCEILLPKDVAYLKEATKEAQNHGISLVNNLPLKARALDIGPETIALIGQALKKMKTVLWNGPLGVFENPPFDQGTIQVAQEVGRLTQEGSLTSIAGGGETAAAMTYAGVAEKLTGLSLAGGAFLEALEGKPLPKAKGDT